MDVFLHDGALGDLVYSLAVIKQIGGGVIFTRKKVYNIVERLVSRQPYIDDINDGVPNIPYTNLNGYRIIARKYPHKHLIDCHADLLGISVVKDESWLSNIPTFSIREIVVSRTMKRHNTSFDWRMLEKYNRNIVFVGFKNEYNAFHKEVGFDVMFMQCSDGFELASVINGAKLFIGNQSFAFSIAEGLKKPRILEVDLSIPNCTPSGKDGYTAIDDSVIGRYLNG